jgi:Ca2+-dependent lipid-binding protein
MEFGDRNMNKVANSVAKRVKQIISQRLVYPNGFVHYFDKTYESTQKIRHALLKSGTMSISVVSAANLPQMSAKTSDPFCVISFDKAKFKTKAIPKTHSPVWDETFYFDVQTIAYDSEIQIQVFDKNTFTKNEPIGSLTIPLSVIPINAISRKIYPLVLSESTRVSLFHTYTHLHKQIHSSCRCQGER